jgi:[protein-PII] uridylyltransferase
LFVVRNLRRFYVTRFADEFPHCSEIMQRIPKPELLYIAALYHDIAKGRGGDHSELGAQDAERFCQRHGLSTFDTRLVSWLVKYHLKISLTAQKKDIQDPDVVNEFAHFVGDQLHLDYLYLLTVADIRATNPKLWNTWRGALLKGLYDATRRTLRRGLDNLIDKDERIAEVQEKALLKLLNKNIEQGRVLNVWQGFNDDYFLRYSVEEIVWHTRAILKKADDDRALVLIRQDPMRGGSEVFLYTRDIGGIFATTTATLDRLGLNILDARIITSDNGYTLDSFTVLEDSGQPIVDRMRSKEIIDALRDQLNQPEQRSLESNRYIPRVLKHFHTPTEINFDQDDINQRTLLEIITSDRPGLLCRIGRAFMDCEIQLQNAKIATIGARAEDIFFIADKDGEPLRDMQKQKDLRAALTRHLDNGT